jgi:hypothetical protein
MSYFLILLSSLLVFLDRKELFNRKIFKKPIKYREWSIITLMSFSIIFSIKVKMDEDFDSKYLGTTGRINSSKIKSPIFLKTSDQNVEISNGIFDLAEYDPVNFGNNVLKVWIEDEVIKIDLDVKNNEGFLVAQVRNNEWKLNEGTYFDRNFDEKGLEIKDKKTGNIILQVDLIEKNVICLQAILPSTDSTATYITGCDCPIYVVSSMLTKDNAVERQRTIMPIIPIFKYPSDLYKGQREIDRPVHPMQTYVNSMKKYYYIKGDSYIRKSDPEILR